MARKNERDDLIATILNKNDEEDNIREKKFLEGLSTEELRALAAPETEDLYNTDDM